MLIPIVTGLAAGSLHVVTGPDHLAAVAPIALRDPLRAARVGAAWGLGHGLGVAALGGLGMIAREAVDISGLSGWSEFSVGFLLVGLGLWSLRAALKMQVHGHEHAHDGEVHLHPHVHLGDGAHDAGSHKGHTHTAFGIGVFHGAAGMGHLLGVVPALALPAAQSAAYLVAYLLAAVLSMAGFGFLLGQLGRRAGPRPLRAMLVAAACFTLVVGVAWLATTFPGVA